VRPENSFSHGERWKRLISKYIQTMLPMGSKPSADEQIIASTSFAEIQAINAKVGEAARPIQPATSRVSTV
jgi:hypothetical protein